MIRRSKATGAAQALALLLVVATRHAERQEPPSQQPETTPTPEEP